VAILIGLLLSVLCLGKLNIGLAKSLIDATMHSEFIGATRRSSRRGRINDNKIFAVIPHFGFSHE
jgi:hypothetical protein